MNETIRDEANEQPRRKGTKPPEQLKKEEDGIILNLHIQPGAAQTAFAGIYNGRLKVKLQARAIEGAANKSLCDFLSQQLHVSKSSVILRKGAKSREKQIFIAGDPETLAQRAESLIAAQ